MSAGDTRSTAREIVDTLRQETARTTGLPLADPTARHGTISALEPIADAIATTNERLDALDERLDQVESDMWVLRR